jgi:uncharacterized protein
MASYQSNGSFLERLLFENRKTVIGIFLLITIFLGYYALQLRPEASFLRMIPTYHPYIENYMKYQGELKGMGNVLRVAVETKDGDIFTEKYLKRLQEIHDEIFFIPGIDRRGVLSLWAPMFRWNEVTEQGFDGGPVIPDTYDGSESSREDVRRNVLRTGAIGELVANDFKSSIVYAPILDFYPDTGKPIDYKTLSEQLERIRSKYQDDTFKIHITGFAKIVGDLIEGINRVMLFFGIAFVFLILVLYLTSRCVRSTAVRAVSSIVAVLWQMGMLRFLGYGLNPYSMLVPFLLFALGVSHGIQMNNAMLIEMGKGSDKYSAARAAWRRIYVPGLAALITDALGFATLFVIMIGVIQDIAVGATIGVIVVSFTDLILLPIILSYTGLNPKSIERQKTQEMSFHPGWRVLCKLINTKPAMVAILIGALVFGYGFYAKRDLKIGDLDPGAPELRVDSRYNQDVDYMTSHYSSSSDIYVAMLVTPPARNSDYNTLVAVDRLEQQLSELDEVQSVISLASQVKRFVCAFAEGNLKWISLPRSQSSRESTVMMIDPRYTNTEGTFSPIIIYLKDHKAETLQKVTRTIEAFAAENNSESGEFLLAAGNAGIEAVTNIEIEKAQLLMTIIVFGTIFLTVLITFRSLRAAVCILIPLYISSVLCEMLMARLGMGVKVATLPVIAVGVGIGVDYGVYLYSRFLETLKQGASLRDAYYDTLTTTGRAVIFTASTLSIGVGTWIFSPIKFQADMGLLLTFMFVSNAIGALFLMPALVRMIGVPKKVAEAAKATGVH